MISIALLLLSIPFFMLFFYGLMVPTPPYRVGYIYAPIMQRKALWSIWIGGPGCIACLIAAGYLWR